MKICLYCGVQLKRHQMSYCGHSHQNFHRQILWIDRWLRGEESGIVQNKGKDATSVRIRKYLISVRGEKCERCDWSERNEFTGRVPIELEHIDGHWNNNKIENLILLCPNCHSLTSTYRSLNAGNGRRSRRIGSVATAAVL